MHKRLIALLGILLGSYAPAAAQTPATQIALAQEHAAPALTTLRRLPAPSLNVSILLYQDPVKLPPHFGPVYAGAIAGDHSLNALSAREEVTTLFVSQSSVPLVNLWSGRLQLNGFESALNMQMVQFGPLINAGMPDFRRPRQIYPAGVRSVDLSGVSLSFHFGRDARTVGPTQAWKCLSRIVGTVLH